MQGGTQLALVHRFRAQASVAEEQTRFEQTGIYAVRILDASKKGIPRSKPWDGLESSTVSGLFVGSG